MSLRRATKATVLLVTLIAANPPCALAQGNGRLQLHYLNVGQGDSALLISPRGETVLFDSGPGNCGALTGYLAQLRLTRIDYHIASHYHADHISCTPQVLSSFPLRQFAIDRGSAYSTATFSSYAAAVGSRRQTAAAGQVITLDAWTTSPVSIRIAAVNANGVTTTEENDLSVSAVVHFGNFHAELGGDMEGVYQPGGYYQPDPTPPPAGATARCNDRTWSYSQNRSGTCSYHGGVWYWVCPGLLCTQTPTTGRANVESAMAAAVGTVEVYKVHHHGSSTSSTADWLNRTRPKVAVISVGNNGYGHPTIDALNRLHGVGARTYWTALGSGASPLTGWDTVNGTTVVEVKRGAYDFAVRGVSGVQSYSTWESAFFPPASPPFSNYDRDRLDDLAVFRPSLGVWMVQKSTGGVVGIPWGEANDIPVAGDYDGDGVSDVAVFRPSTGIWYIVRSSTGAVAGIPWGAQGDLPVPADYDGDGRMDVAVFRPTTAAWYIVNSGSGAATGQVWGATGDRPVPADYDGDGKTDIAVFRPTTGAWYVVSSSTGTASGQSWGTVGDSPVAADFDGDGRADVAVFRPTSSAWYIIRSSGGVELVSWGTVGDAPVVRDFDGDGRADVAVFREATGAWYIVHSSTGLRTGQVWGTVGDKPV